MVTITRLDGKEFEWCQALPSAKGLEVEWVGNRAFLEIPESDLPLQLFIDMNDMEQAALLIFADPTESDVPDRDSDEVELILPGDSIESVRKKLTSEKSYVVFGSGIHRWG